ncbi:MAG: MerR family transcriptional regulator [Lachnospiraceae bacterium]|nr:MerR family transcriptional regulator [Lachnospiraceae bacterium]
MAEKKAKSLRVRAFAEAMGVSADFVKFYHESGILEPWVDPEDRYRSFDVWQGNRLVMAKCYRKMGFSLGEIARLMNCSDSAEIIRMMREKEKEVDRELRRLSNLRQSMSDWKESCERCYENVNQWEIASRPGYYIVDYMEGPEFLLEEERQEILTSWMESPYLTIRLLRTYADEALEEGREIIYGAVAIERGWLDMQLAAPAARYIFTVPPCEKCFYYNYVEEWRPGRSHEMLHLALDRMHKEGFHEVPGDILMLNVLETYKEGKRDMSYRISVPVG